MGIAVGIAASAKAEMTHVKVGTQFGLAYLPLLIMEHDRLWEAKAKERGIDLTVDYARFGGGSPLNDALLSDSVQVISGGVAPLLVLSDRTRGNYRVKALTALNASPMYLLTNNPAVRSIKDFDGHDRIAVPSIKVSIQAIVLAMATEQALGPGKSGALDNIEVAMAHPEAYIALTKGSSQITAYMSSSPFQERALQQSGIRKVIDSFEVLGGPTTFAVSAAKSDFVASNPKLVAAFGDAQKSAVELIRSDLPGAIDEYYAVTQDKTDRTLVEAILRGPAYDFDLLPKHTAKIAEFMYRTGAIKHPMAAWQDYFFDALQDDRGS